MIYQQDKRREIANCELFLILIPDKNLLTDTLTLNGRTVLGKRLR
jgi:hypothetical protein